MRLFIYLWLSAGLATLMCLPVLFLAPEFSLTKLLGSGLFALFLSAMIGFPNRAPYDSGRAMIGAPILFIVSVVSGTFVGMFTYQVAPFVLFIFSFPMNVVGYYPSGPDMLFSYGALLWTATVFVLISIGIFLGSLIRDRRRRIAHTDAD